MNTLLTQAEWKGAVLKDVIVRELVSTVVEGPPTRLGSLDDQVVARWWRTRSASVAFRSHRVPKRC
jgi:hypothetical protein